MASITARPSVRSRKRRDLIRNARWRIGASRSPAGRTSISRWCRRRPRSWPGRNCSSRRKTPSNASPVERALIEALSHRYANPQPEDRAPLDQAYADAMREVWKKFPNDPDVGALFAEAMMDLASVGSMDAGRPAKPGHG